MSSTTIRIDTETREQLRTFGQMGESYDDVIKHLLEIARLAAQTKARGVPYRPARTPGLPITMG